MDETSLSLSAPYSFQAGGKAGVVGKKAGSLADAQHIDNLSYNTIQTELIQSQDKIAAAESANNLEVAKHKEVLEKFQGTIVHRHRLEKAKVEYNRIKEDIDRSKLIVATLKQ